MSWWTDIVEYVDLYVGDYFRGWHLPPPELPAALAAGAALIFVLWKSRHNYEKLAKLQAAPEGFEPDATVIIPARNEAANIAGVLESFPGANVIVVDDASSDKTAESAAALGAAVVPAPPLKKNHKGKPAACWAGAKLVQSKWILFVDADTRYEPGMLASVIHFAETNKVDAVSVLLRQERLTAAERILLPYALALNFCGVSSESVNRTKSADALANGQCFLVKREAYEHVGGHAAVVESVVEDVALTRALKHQGKKVRVVRGEHLGRARMFESFAALWDGFQRNSCRFLLLSPWTGFQVLVSSVLLALWLPVLAWLLLEQQWWSAALFALLPSLLMWKWYGNWRNALFAPAAIYVFPVIALAGMYHASFGRPTRWKGRRV